MLTPCGLEDPAAANPPEETRSSCEAQPKTPAGHAAADFQGGVRNRRFVNETKPGQRCRELRGSCSESVCRRFERTGGGSATSARCSTPAAFLSAGQSGQPRQLSTEEDIHHPVSTPRPDVTPIRFFQSVRPSSVETHEPTISRRRRPRRCEWLRRTGRLLAERATVPHRSADRNSAAPRNAAAGRRHGLRRCGGSR